VFQRQPQYAVLESREEAKADDETNRFTRHRGCLLNLAISFTALTIASFLGFYFGRLSLDTERSTDLLSPAGDLLETWTYNRTFSQAPNEEAEFAWRSIFPKGRGFVHHPTLAPNISGIAVFHELHCLSGIRLAYYAALAKDEQPNTDIHDHHDSLNPRKPLQAQNHEHSDPAHIRHCFDYLRHALMCAADTNLENIDWKYGGATGWGFERKCRNYNAVVVWAEQWRTHSQTDIS